MIFIVGKKAFLKNAKQLIKKKDFVIIDATDDESGKLSNVISPVSVKDELAPPAKLVDAILDPDVYEYEIDKRKLKQIWKKWGKKKKCLEALYAIFRIMIEENLNVFIVLDTKAYKAMKDKYCEYVNGMMDSRIKFVYTYDEYLEDRNSLIRDLSKSDIKDLKSVLKDIENDLENRFDDDDDLFKKKKKKKKEDNEKSMNYSKFFKDIFDDKKEFHIW